MAKLSVNIIYDKLHTNRVNIIEGIFKNASVNLLDIREPLTHCDVNIHVDIPIFSAVPWAYTNILFVDSDKWSQAYDAYLHAFDIVINTRVDIPFKGIPSKGIPFEGDVYEIPLENSDAFLPVLTNIISLVNKRKNGLLTCPPILLPEDCPPISIITPTYNREKFIDIAFHNLLATDYPRDKIEWIVVEDNEHKEKMYSEKIISFQLQSNIRLKYIPIEGRMSIGEKRNHGIEHASNDIILFMDDDDHYPVTSFRRRVAWLLKGIKKDKSCNIACCTTIALYDLQFGTSAVNVPPFDISFGQRISEATLTFKKSAWIERKFLDVSIAEGESWVSGREDQVLEMQPQQIIVAFSHANNISSRKIPSDKPSCFWGFPKEYLMFIHSI